MRACMSPMRFCTEIWLHPSRQKMLPKMKALDTLLAALDTLVALSRTFCSQERLKRRAACRSTGTLHERQLV